MVYFLGVRGLTTSSYIVYKYTTSGSVDYITSADSTLHARGQIFALILCSIFTL